MNTSLYIVKIGGNIIDDEAKLSLFLKDFAAIEGKKILVHGGGKLATKLAAQLKIPQQVIDGRRITDIETLKIVTMVYAGFINKNIVAKLQASSCNTIGLTGADGNTILAHKRSSNTPPTGGEPGIDYGFVGDIDAIDVDLIHTLLEKNIALVFAPITHNQQGQLLNTNADTIAQELAKGLSKDYDVTLVYSFEKAGVLLNINDDSTVIPTLNPEKYSQLKSRQKIVEGMIPKLDNAFTALSSGVKKVIVGKAENLKELIAGTSGTSIIND